MLNKLPIIGVMGAGGASHDEFAGPLGCAIAENGWNLLTGGGLGVMEVAAKAFTAVENRAGRSIGILPTRPLAIGGYEQIEGYPNPYIEIPIVTHLGNFDGSDPAQISRNFINILSSDVVVALPGSKGTRNEVALAIKFGKPIILFGPASAFLDFSEGTPQTEKLDEVLSFIQLELRKKK